MDPWLTLAFAGLFEVGFTTCLKLEERSKGFIVPFLICAGISFTLLSQALQSIPLGTAYAVWTGIGGAGTFLIGVLFFGDALTVWRTVGVALIVGGVITLNLAQ